MPSVRFQGSRYLLKYCNSRDGPPNSILTRGLGAVDWPASSNENGCHREIAAPRGLCSDPDIKRDGQMEAFI